MKTDDLVAALAGAAAPVDPRAAQRSVSLQLLAAGLLALAVVLLLLGPRADWRSAVELPMFWLKLAVPGATALAAFVLLRRLGHPGMPVGLALPALALPAAALWLLAAWVLANAPAAVRPGLVLGTSAWTCVAAIAVLALPAFVLALRAMTRLAPTRLALTGAVAGLFAGSVAAFAYAIWCREMEAPFLAAWYLLGMSGPTALGALLGRRVLRW